MKLNINTVFTAFVLGVLSVSCSDSSEWTPGPQDNETGVSAYFPAQSSGYRFVFGSDAASDDMVIPVTISRVNASGEASVPVILKSDVSGFSAPASVDFKAGMTSADFAINCSGIPQGSFQDVTIILPDDETDIYGPGVTELTLSAIISDWDVISENVTYYYNDMYPTTTGKLYHLKGSAMFRFTDFYGSGLELPFEATTGDMIELVPTANADPYSYYYPEDAFNCWYLYDEANEDWPSWTPGGDSDKPAIEYALFYGTSEFSSICLIYNKSTLYGYGSNTIDLSLSDGSYAWGYFQLDFNLLYDPFATIVK